MLIGDRHIEVRDILEKLGVEVEIETNGWLVAKCPLHADAHRSFAINEENGGWVCYAGCGKGSLVKLVAEYAEIHPSEARRRLIEEGEVTTVDQLLAELEKQERSPVARPEPELEDFFFEEGKTYRYLSNRGFTPETLKAFNVGRDTKMLAVVIPAYEGPRLVGLVKRRIAPQSWQMKYDYTKRWAKSAHVFALDRCEGDEVIIVEGALDAMWLHQYGFPGVALLGSHMSEEQKRKILKKARRVILCLDSDQAGTEGTLHALDLLLPTGVEVLVVRWPTKWVSEWIKGKEYVREVPVYKDIQECPEEMVTLIIEHAEPAYSPTP